MIRIYIVCFVCCAILFRTGQGLTCDDGYVSNGKSCDECGLTSITPNVKIVGGIDAVPNSWPAQALITITYKGDHNLGGTIVTVQEYFECGGTLINPYTILTASHCLDQSFIYAYSSQNYNITMNFTNNPYYFSFLSVFTVYLGAHNVSSIRAGMSLTSPTSQYAVSAIIQHPLYDANSGLYDIALMILSNSVTYTQEIQPACLPPSSQTYPPENSISYTTGWGALSSGGPHPDVLQNVNLTVYNFSYCLSVVPTQTKDVNSQICAGELAGGKDSCQGDSGSGLYVLDTLGGKQRYIVSGITSYGDGCGKPNSPGIYTRVSNFVDWIESNWKEGDPLLTTLLATITTTTTSLTTTQMSSATLAAIIVPIVVGVLLIVAAIVTIILLKKYLSSRAHALNTSKVGPGVLDTTTTSTSAPVSTPAPDTSTNLQRNKFTTKLPPIQTPRNTTLNTPNVMNIINFKSNQSILTSNPATTIFQTSNNNLPAVHIPASLPKLDNISTTKDANIDRIEEGNNSTSEFLNASSTNNTISYNYTSTYLVENENLDQVKNSQTVINENFTTSTETQKTVNVPPVQDNLEPRYSNFNEDNPLKKVGKSKMNNPIDPVTEEPEEVDNNDNLKTHDDILQSIEDALKNKKANNT